MENVSASPGQPKILVVSRDAHFTEVRTTLETAGSKCSLVRIHARLRLPVKAECA